MSQLTPIVAELKDCFFMIHEYSAESLRAEIARTRQQLAEVKQRLAETEAERDHYYYRSLKQESDLAFYRQPSSDREFCAECGRRRDQYCPCGAMFPQ